MSRFDVLALRSEETTRHDMVAFDRFERVAELVETGKLSGAVGTFANVPPTVERSCDVIGLNAPTGSQVFRDLHTGL